MKAKVYPRITAKVFGEPWIITKERHYAIQRLLEQRAEGLSFDMDDDGDEEEEIEIGRSGSTAVIPVVGVIGKHLSGLEIECGGCDLDSVQTMFRAALSDDSIERVLFRFDSPGGTVTGVPEMGRMIANSSKPTLAFTDSDCCSGAYWLASQCDEIFATPSSTIGSIGVYQAVLDLSRQMENEGVKMNAISAGKYKLMGAYWKPLSDEERAMLQAGVDKVYAQFVDAVNRKRVIDSSYCQGQCFDGEEAQAAGLISSTIESLDELLDEGL